MHWWGIRTYVRMYICTSYRYSVCIPYSIKVRRGESLADRLFLSIWQMNVWRINRSANRLSIVRTNLDGFSLVNHGWFAKFAKLSPYQTFPLYSIWLAILLNATWITIRTYYIIITGREVQGYFKNSHSYLPLICAAKLVHRIIQLHTFLRICKYQVLITHAKMLNIIQMSGYMHWFMFTCIHIYHIVTYMYIRVCMNL